MHKRLLLYACVIFLFIIPFFWLDPGEVDLGGDSSRLYFYDPLSYLKSFPLYAVVPNGFNSEITAYYLIPFVLFLAILKTIFFSPYLLATLFNSLTLVVAFLAVYGIVTTLLRFHHQNALSENLNISFAGILAGLFYVFSPILTQAGWWAKALVVHNQFFLNQLVFFLLLKYIHSKNFRYLIFIIIISFIFAPNFFLSPYFFSFYPFIVVFLLIYAFITKQHLRIKEIVTAILLFLTVQAFHFTPFLISLFSAKGYLHETAFSVGEFNRIGLDYFLGVAQVTKVTNNLFSLPQGNLNGVPLYFAWGIIPTLLVLGLIAQAKVVNVRKETTHVFSLILIFFLLLTFFSTAKITNISLELYKLFFIIPGFSMFRNFVGQFSHTFVFFYALTLGFSFFYILSYLKSTSQKYIFSGFVLTLLLVSGLPFIRGDNIDSIIILHPIGNIEQKVPVPIQMDEAYENFLKEIKKNRLDGKYLTLPLDDAGSQTIAGKDGGYYMGPPLISYLGGKSEFVGVKGLAPFENIFLNAVFTKDYEIINNLLSIFNIRYIFHNSDPAVYDDAFPGYPYAFARKFMPNTQTLYSSFLNLLAISPKRDFNSNYHLYELDKKFYLPHIYIAKEVVGVISDSPETILNTLHLPRDDLRIAIVAESDLYNMPNIDGDIVVEAEKKNTIVDRFGKISQTAAGVIDADLASRIIPLAALGDNIRRHGLPLREKFMLFDKTVFSAQSYLKQLDLSSYQKTMLTLTEEGMTGGFYSPLMEKVRLARVLIRDQNSFKELIDRQSFSNEEKNNLFALTDKTFSALFEALKTSIPSSKNTTYEVKFPQSRSYEVFLEKNAINNIDYQKLILASDGKALPVNKNQVSQGSWIAFNQVRGTDFQKNTFSLIQPESPYPFDESLLSVVDNNHDETYWVNVSVSGIALNYFQELVSYFYSWLPNTTYFITFEYLNPLDGKTWITYKTIIEVDSKGTKAQLLVLKNELLAPLDVATFFNNPYGAALSIRNLAVIPMPKPSLLLKTSRDSDNGQKELPKITFTKINPTKYKVAVSKAEEPYTLVFLDAFNENWQLFLSNDQSDKDETTESYFQGQVNEGKHTNIFFDGKTFETFGSKPIAETAHYKVNGYANGWHIEPSDTDGKTDYTLILELTSQRQLYLLLSLSVVVITGCTAWLLKEYIWKIAGRKKHIN